MVACLVATLSVAAYVYVSTPPTYEANASVVLVPPVEQVKEGSNPFLYMGGLEQALAVLTVRVGSPAVADPILGKDPSITYTVARDAGTAGPIVRITAEGYSEAVTLRILNDVVKAMPESMTYLQDELKVPAKVRITVMTIVQDETAKPVMKKQQRLVLTLVAVGALLTVLATAILDRMLTARKTRRNRGPGTDEKVQDGNPEPPEIPEAESPVDLKRPVVRATKARTPAPAVRDRVKTAVTTAPSKD